MRYLLILASICFITGCADSNVESCLEAVASNLGTLTAQELTDYNNQGCCQFQGGVSFVDTCSGTLVCKDGSDSTCHK